MIQAEILEIESIVCRASSFKRVYFYKKEVIDPYLLASYGFLIKSNDPSIALCEYCHKQIQFDRQGQICGIKDQLIYALNDHDERCSLQQRKITGTLITSIYKHAEYFFNKISESYKDSNISIRLKMQTWQQLLSEEEKQLYQLLDPKCREKQKLSKQLILSILGWKLINSQALVCQYCSEKCELSARKFQQGFDYFSSHRAWCLIRHKNLWKKILRKLAYIKTLKNKEVVAKTNSQKKALQVKQILGKIYIEQASQFDNIKKNIEYCKQQQGKNKANLQLGKRCLDQLYNSTKQFEDTIQKIIKKIKF